MRSVAIGAVLAGLALAGPAFGQSSTRSDTVYENISPADLRAIVQSMGYASVANLDATSLEVTTGSGFLFYVYSMSCDEEPTAKGAVSGGCYGVEISTSWTVEADQTASVTAAADRYNAQYSLLKTFTDSEGSLRAQRYVITDGGVTWAHIQRELDEFLYGVDYMLDEIQTDTGIDFVRPEVTGATK